MQCEWNSQVLLALTWNLVINPPPSLISVIMISTIFSVSSHATRSPACSVTQLLSKYLVQPGNNVLKSKCPTQSLQVNSSIKWKTQTTYLLFLINRYLCLLSSVPAAFSAAYDVHSTSQGRTQDFSSVHQEYPADNMQPCSSLSFPTPIDAPPTRDGQSSFHGRTQMFVSGHHE